MSGWEMRERARQRGRHGFLEQARPWAIAHRGGALEVEENTMPAFSHAVNLGYSHVELDVHATRDGVVVIHHDPTLERICGDPRAIADLSWDELRRLRTRQGATIPRLADLFEEHPDLYVNIEAKSDAVVEPLAHVVRAAQAVERIGTGSFEAGRTAALLAELGARLCWSPSHGGVARLWLRGWHFPLRLGAFPVVQVPTHFRGIRVVTPRFVRAAHRAGVQVQVWTVNECSEMEHLMDMGVDGIMTDRPSLLRDVLDARGEWRAGDA